MGQSAVGGLFGAQKADDSLRKLVLRGLHLLVLQLVLPLEGQGLAAALLLKVLLVKAVLPAVVFLQGCHVLGEEPLQQHQVHQLSTQVAVAAQDAHVPEAHPAVDMQQIPLLPVEAGHELIIPQLDGLLLQKAQQQVGELGAAVLLGHPHFHRGHAVKGVAPRAFPQGHPPDHLPPGGAHKGGVAAAPVVSQPFFVVVLWTLPNLQAHGPPHGLVDSADGGSVLHPGPAHFHLHAFNSPPVYSLQLRGFSTLLYMMGGVL